MMTLAGDAFVDSVVIGGGLAGLLGALRLADAGHSVVLFDQALPQAGGRLGGFAEFSGAKFSFLPAGQGLIAPAGSREALVAATEEVLDRIELTSLIGSPVMHAVPIAGAGLDLRAYSSIVIEPAAMQALIDRLEGYVASRCRIVHGKVESLLQDGSGWLVECGGVRTLSCRVLYAGGRSGSDLIQGAGAVPQTGKGIDVGVRLEFPSRVALDGLRSIGPDAKVMSGGCRTFCLNSPGHIYRYFSDGLSIPGGVVAADDVPSANVGILLRVEDKNSILARTRTLALQLGAELYEQAPLVFGSGLADKASWSRQAWGDDVVEKLEVFCKQLRDQSLINFSERHMVHWPLLDWHWPVFGLSGTAATTKSGLYVAGDSAGHARGLLQAAVSGWLAAGEIVHDA